MFTRAFALLLEDTYLKRRCIERFLAEGSQDFEMLDKFVTEYKELSQATKALLDAELKRRVEAETGVNK